MKKIITKIFVFVAVLFLLSCGVYADSEYKIEAGGIKIDAQIIENENKLFIPVRSVAESVGINVAWDNESRSALLEAFGNTIVIPENKNYVLKNNQKVSIDGKAQIFSNKLYLQLEAIDGILNQTVEIDKINKIIKIKNAQPMKVHFFDCGQGDSIFIELPDKKCMLIDSGTQEFAPSLIENIKKSGYEKIDYLVATHPHIDHIGSMAQVLKTFKIGKLFTIDKTHFTKTYANMIEAIVEKGCKTEYIKRGSHILSGRVKCTVLSPDNTVYEKLNDSSAVIRLEYEDVSFLFSADAEISAEENMLNASCNLKSNILKVGHHGSESSTSDKYLLSVAPEVAIISVGENNEYGYPSEDLIKRIEEKGIAVYRTDRDGTITITTDGKKYDIKKGDI